MTFYADASFVLALYRDSRFSAAAEKAVTRLAPLILLSPMTRLECVRSLSRDGDPAGLARFRADLAGGESIRMADVASWSEGFRLAETWAERTARVASTGATDVLVVALASLGGASHFMSFDSGSRQRAVALMAGMELVPKASSAERALARRL